MEKRLDCPRCYPIWVWTKRPDLRRRWSSDKGAIYILLQVRIAESMVLLPDFDLWHCVLNYFPLELYDGESIDKVGSWEQIFDLELIKKSPYLTREDEGLYLQGITLAIPIANIKPVKSFQIRFGIKNKRTANPNHQ